MEDWNAVLHHKKIFKSFIWHMKDTVNEEDDPYPGVFRDIEIAWDAHCGPAKDLARQLFTATKLECLDVSGMGSELKAYMKPYAEKQAFKALHIRCSGTNTARLARDHF